MKKRTSLKSASSDVVSRLESRKSEARARKNSSIGLVWSAALFSEWLGCVVAAILSAFAFFLPQAVGMQGMVERGVSAALFFGTCVVWEVLGIRSKLNPATHFQQLLYGKLTLKSCVVFSLFDMFGYMVGNAIALLGLQILQPSISIAPGPPTVSYMQVLIIEAFLFVALQLFFERISSSAFSFSLFCTLVIFFFLDQTGSYSSQSAYFSKVLLYTQEWDPMWSAYLLGPYVGSAAAIPLLEMTRNKQYINVKED